MKKLSVIWMAVALFMVGCSEQSEGGAKKVLETYLEHMEKGETEEAEVYLDDYTDNLIDVFAYEYLSTLEEEDVQVETTMYEGLFEESDFFKEEYGTWDNYAKEMWKLYGDNEDYVFKDEGNSITFYKKGDMKKVVTFLYDMEVANGLGNKLYKKIEFTLEWDTMRWNGEDFEEGFVITDIEIRGGDE